jgi:hypothetical protein
VDWALLLEYLKAILTWPVAVVVIVALLRKEIRDLAGRIVSVRFPGGELRARQQGEVAASAGDAQVGRVVKREAMAFVCLNFRGRANSQWLEFVTG